MKKNKLYTVNKYNMPAFMPKNLFGLGGDQSVFFQHQGGGTYGNTDNISMDLKSIPSTTNFYQSSQPNFQNQQWANNQMNNVVQSINTGENKNSSTVNQGNSWGTVAKAVGGAAAEVAASPMTIDGRTYKRGLFDATDPFYHAGDVTFSDGNKGHIENRAGNLFSDAGVKVFQGGASSGNGYVMLAGAALKSVGDIINNGWGLAYNDKAINTVTKNTENSRNVGNTLGSASNTNDLMTLSNYLNSSSGYGSRDLVKGGVFSKKKARRKGQRYINKENAALAFQNTAFMNAVTNVDKRQDENIMRNFAAYGGPLDTIGNNNMGAIEYGFMSDYLTNRRKLTENKNQMTNMFMGSPSTMFAFGGDMQTNSADFPTGLTHIDAGGSHEENPNDGVQMGVDNEGTPNLVEEGETVYNDYVFSNRITCDETTKKLFHLPKKKDVTYAEVSKKLEKEIQERPNDPISRAGFNAQMQKLEEQQERQKQEMEAERAKAAFEALSPEEQTAVMQQVANGRSSQGDGIEEQMAPEEAMMAANSGENPTEMQGVVPTADAVGTVAPQEDMNQQMMAKGGKLFEDGGNKKKNVGTWKDDKENHWDVFTKPGLKAYIESIKQKLAMAPDDATKDAIRREAMNELNSLQQSYFSYVLPDTGKEKYDYSEDVKNHQILFDKLYGNTGFYSTDENGNVRNLIADAINLPNGAATEDKPEHWADGYNGRRTSIRNFGSTEYGDDKYYKDLVDEFAQLGLTYAPNDNWKYGDNRLYALSLPEATAAKATEPKVWDWNTGDWVDKVAEPEGEASGTVATVKKEAIEEEKEKQIPKLRSEWMRYAGLFGPAAGLGLMAAGVGKPDYSRLDAALEGAGNAHLADYKPLGNYLTYRPMDIWFEQNRMDANARATDRAIMNSSSPSKMAGLLASGYNNQIANGELYRKALEYNDAKRKDVAEFNRGTDQFNAQAYNQNQQFNADARNKARQYRASLAMQAATERLNRDAGWYNSLYGNVAGLFRGLGDLGRENAQWNMISKAAADTTNLGDSNTADIYLKKKKKSQGGKVRRKKGLTY